MQPHILSAFVATLAFRSVASQNSPAPSVTTKNGPLVGVYLPTYNQDAFLGVPFAQPPVGDLRLQLPQPINESWTEPRQATQYYPECVGYGGNQGNFNLSEDCLALNVIRPSGHEGQSLPVAFWIHGGGWTFGGTADPMYNLSSIVQNSVEMGKPIIAVSVAYRLSAWGFLDSREIRDAGATNLGIHDQRIALQWLQDNIAGFGGDPSKVTIWGESAGGASVGLHLTAYGGRDDSLFSGAVCESGNSIRFGPANYNVSQGQVFYDNVTAAVGCSDHPDTLQCLRSVDFDTLSAAFAAIPLYSLYPFEDGDLIRGSQHDQLVQGNFVKVPLLSGTNTDEGSAFGPPGINTDNDFTQYLRETGGTRPLNASTIATLEAVYPDLPAASDVLFNVPLSCPFNSTLGQQYRRSVAFGGDFVVTGPRRLQCQSWSTHGVPAYCYRFNTVAESVFYPLSNLTGSTHFAEVAFVLNNLAGLGYHFNPFAGQPQTYADLSHLMTRMWISFVADADPNAHGVPGYAPWPAYNVSSGGGVGYGYLFDANTTSRPELDSWRAAGIEYLNTLWRDVYGK